MSKFEITLVESDFEEVAEESASGILILGGKRDPADKPPSAIIQEITPKVISRKLEKLIPPDYQLTQVRMDVQLKGSVFGQEISGTVQVTFSPKGE
ncbi:hypothetical protein [Sedimentitalea sp.]|uniref:hypothetical protein n=1 Tax=Sedimentitalea sp. TaxID=2048915 RepID=UPI0032994639